MGGDDWVSLTGDISRIALSPDLRAQLADLDGLCDAITQALGVGPDKLPQVPGSTNPNRAERRRLARMRAKGSRG